MEHLFEHNGKYIIALVGDEYKNYGSISEFKTADIKENLEKWYKHNVALHNDKFNITKKGSCLIFPTRPRMPRDTVSPAYDSILNIAKNLVNTNKPLDNEYQISYKTFS